MEGMWRECGGNVEGMWRECGGNVEGMWRECGGNVSSRVQSLGPSMRSQYCPPFHLFVCFNNEVQKEIKYRSALNTHA